MGTEYDKAISAEMGLYSDSSLQSYVRSLGNEMASRCERPNLPWSFKVIDDPVVNAFALPGGFIYVTRGILAHLNSEAELAGVVGHEIGHVTGKHSVTRMSTQKLTQFGLGVGAVLDENIAKYGKYASAGLGVLFLKFGRNDEKEADALGVRYTYKINRDSREMIGVMTMLDRVTSAHGGSRIPEWLSTHPDPGNRADKIRYQIDTMGNVFENKIIARNKYLDMIDGIIFDDNPRQGFFKENIFYHPDFKFRINFPNGWKTYNQISAVIGISPKEDAIIQLTIAQELTARAAAQKFFSQDSLIYQQLNYEPVNGLKSISSEFTYTSEGNSLKGLAYFIEFNGNVYQILSYSNSSKWIEYRSESSSSCRSFRQLTDKRMLNVQPWRLKIVKLSSDMTLESYYGKNPTPITLETLELINRVSRTTRLKAGYRIKTVIGQKF
jgi:predicted Zn-dependent protease